MKKLDWILLVTVVLGFYAVSLAHGDESCWTKTPEGVRQEIPCDNSAKWTSDEKPPKDKMPSYQREGIKVVDAPAKAADDIKEDQAQQEATLKGIENCIKKFGKKACPDPTAGKKPDPSSYKFTGTAVTK